MDTSNPEGFPPIDLQKIDPDKIPKKMLNRRQWINWRYGESDKGKITKVPSAPWINGKPQIPVSVTDPNNVTTFEEAYKSALNNNIGLGFVFFKGAGISGVDVDHCLADGVPSKLALETVKALPSYAEYSPSGNGIHIIVEGVLNVDGFKNTETGIEAYSTNRFFTFTGDHLPDTPTEVIECQDNLSRFEAIQNPPKTTPETPPPKVDGASRGLKNKLGQTIEEAREKYPNLDQLLRPGNNGYKSASDADAAAASSLVYYEFSEPDIKDILIRFRFREKFNKNKKYLDRTITSAREFVTTTVSQNQKTMDQLLEDFNKKTEEARDAKKEPTLIEKMLNLFIKDSFKTAEDVEALYRYKEGTYVSGDTYVKGAVESAFGTATNSGLCAEVVGHLKRRSYTPRIEFNKFEGEIPVENGLLNLETGDTTDFRTDKIFTFKIQTKYDKTKSAPKWLKFLEDILPDEKDRLALQEYAGYCLYPRMSFHKICFLVGDGRNGKGAFIRTIQGILGQENISNIRIDYLNGGHRFIATNLYGKLVNVSSEPSTRWPLQTELLKALSGEDWLDGEVKGKQNPIKFPPFAKHFVQGNKMPKVNDTSLGWWDRVLIIIFEMQFTEESGKQVKDIEDKWLNDPDERSGILNWLIEGWLRLKANGRFTQSKTQKEAMIQFKRRSDPIAAFLVEECEYGPEYYVLRTTLYDNYKDYAKSLNEAPEGDRVFWEHLRKAPGVNVDHKKRIRGKNERVGLGLRLREHTGGELGDFGDDEGGHTKNDDGAHGAVGTPPVTREHENSEYNKKGDLEKGVETPAPDAPGAPPVKNEPPNCEICPELGPFSYQGRRLCKKHLDEMIKQDGKMK